MSEPERGDLLEIQWVDVNEDVTGDPNKPALAHRTSFGLFWNHTSDSGIPCLVTTTTIDGAAQDGQNGWCIYPVSCIKKMKVVRRSHKPRARRQKVLVEVRSAESNVTPDGDKAPKLRHEEAKLGDHQGKSLG